MNGERKFDPEAEFLNEVYKQEIKYLKEFLIQSIQKLDTFLKENDDKSLKVGLLHPHDHKISIISLIKNC